MVKKSNTKRKRNIEEEIEEEEEKLKRLKPFDFLRLGLFVLVGLLCALELGLAGGSSIKTYETTGSILGATSTFILGIIADLAIIFLVLWLSGSYKVYYVLYSLVGLVIIEVIISIILWV